MPIYIFYTSALVLPPSGSVAASCSCEDLSCHPIAFYALSQTKHKVFALIFLVGDVSTPQGSPLDSLSDWSTAFCWKLGTASSWDFTSAEPLYKGCFTWLVSHSPLECKNKPWFTWAVQFYQDLPCCCGALFKSRGLHMGEDVLKKDRDVTLSQLLWFGNI